MNRDLLHHARRAIAARPGFALIVVISLALGIGANVAIFGLWHRVLRGALPGIAHPDELVMLTNPTAAGMWRGGWDSSNDGPRLWLTYPEFQQLREHGSMFASLMAAQSTTDVWQARVDGGAAEPARGRLVSTAFFDLLGVRPALGRLLTAEDERSASAVAVISQAWWQRRFGGRDDVLGRTLTIRDATVTIVGVAAAGFAGESSGLQQDVWVPLHLQPRVLPGADWLHERPPDKVMWLHVFGRLKPGVTWAQAEAQANGVLRANLEAFYGRVDDVAGPGTPGSERRRALLDQRIRLYPGGRGVSAAVDQFSWSLGMLLAAIAILLLITCANLANLALSSGATRATEMAIRVSLGASRSRLLVQLLVESSVLTLAGALAAIIVARLSHQALVAVLRQSEPGLLLDFRFDATMAAFAMLTTMAAAVVLGLVPAWQTARAALTAPRGSDYLVATGSRPTLQAGRWLVCGQLALSLPLLVCAGLLVQTLTHLQHPVLGFDSAHLLLARADLGPLVQDVDRRDRVLREVRARLAQLPGVERASFSQLGVLGPGMSTAPLEIDGRPSGPTDRDVALDRVGPGYFATLRIPLLNGRDIDERDRADTARVCVVNAAFVRQFLQGGAPLGRRVSVVEADGSRTNYQIVGVAADARTHALRRAVEPRFFVPAEQRRSLGNSRTFLIRTAGAANVAAVVRDTINGVDPALTLSEISDPASTIAELTADDRAVAMLASAFGVVAIVLAATGLYGVLSFGVTRRRREIAVRMALGAWSRRVIALIMRENAVVVVVGLVVGSALAAGAARIIASRLYGITPYDPLTLIAAATLLVAVSALAAYLPARRAATIDPMTVLRNG